ncbi:MAG: alpha-amylase family protein [Melioribacteraceae bacterium]|nr:alpha-amylase family protein [Melioribacteraceae bacterium]MCF8263724.1 alpha-amylase family protein [Melioribacteraceae bacterium]
MPDIKLTEKQIHQTLDRILPRIEEKYAGTIDNAEWHGFIERINVHFPTLIKLLYELYGRNFDFFYHLESILSTATKMWIQRSPELKALDAIRQSSPQWYQSNNMVGAMCYVNLFSDDLKGLVTKIPYLKELGINYIHLMPLFITPEGDNDGGYAVSSYREVDSELGTMEELSLFAAELRKHGMSLVLDFIFNHTADNHDWAKRALKGDEEFQDYYIMFPNRGMPDQYEKTINPVFKDDHPGCFTYRNRIKKWIWTTFHNYQWDLNYANPEVFTKMSEEMLFLANQGIEILRLDAVAFIWKKMGTNCENLPKAHLVIKAFNSLVKIVAPSLLFKSEAIVHPDEVVKYIGEDECQLSYNPQMMALLWNSIATKKVKLLRHSLSKRFEIPQNCTWVNYIRCHDDIGWAFSNEDAEEIGKNPTNHRKFLSDFFVGRFPGTFSRGLPFQEDPNTLEGRVSGTTASLAGLEEALKENDEEKIDLAIKRILLLHGIILSIGGIPLIYLGDEIGLLNDYHYENDTEKIGDTRWIHRPKFDWELAKQRSDAESVPGRLFQSLQKLIQIRKNNVAFSGSDTEFVDLGDVHVLSYFKRFEEYSLFILGNFNDKTQKIAGIKLRQLGLSKTLTDIVSGRTIIATHTLEVEPYQFMVLVGAR